MLDNCQSAKEKWGGVSEIIDRWLRERQDLIVRYCDLIGRGDFDDCEVAVTTFRQFCQVLLDYVSAGHFEVYEQLIEEAHEFNDGGIELAHKLYPEIQRTTEASLDFNDKFDKTPEELEEINAMLPELSKLGEKLEERFELEDMLIAKLHTAHADQVA
ncbi:anti-RNA polymerase sigma 70 factor [Hahella sp. CCB-MM4]|uniref:sigma D regulator n=1 Tax=Hahella sp. (strain CCB-MM4) TaxID=1926491 RepID=UPI000B9B512C|nr:sigma D regulator [Hahella sp. CCB-MM4]OZG74294.1 anti-RNA polymerase sigma 70 factor [Hahella sp. CCB-MM4]